MRLSGLIASIVATGVLGACSPKLAEPEQPPMIGMANPASVHCIQKGGRLDIRTRTGGAEYGVCIFKDGRQCEEWALFREDRCVAPV